MLEQLMIIRHETKAIMNALFFLNLQVPVTSHHGEQRVDFYS